MRLKRTHYCGLVTEKLIGEEVVLCGWVDRWRDHGGVNFIDLRDREGIVQVVFDPADHPIEQAHLLRSEWVISIKGKVRQRPEGMINDKIPSGKIEVLVSELDILNQAQTPPFLMHDDAPSQGETDERVKLQYRYLDLRKPFLQDNLKKRHTFLHVVRNHYHENGFLEIETPILYKSTPEGARDYLVPSRVQPGKFYALPQSPQTLKQLCMVAGFDRYYQIARCFRDEDLRADRQPEFSQVDVEMSFVDPEDIYSQHETLMKKVFKKVLDIDVETPFTRISYETAMEKYGSDKPDLRNPVELIDLTEQGAKCDFKVYRSLIDNGGILKGLCVEETTSLSRKDLDALSKEVEPFGAKGVSWIRIKEPGDWQAPQAKFFSEELKSEIESKLPFKKSCLLFMVCGSSKIVNASLSYLRDKFGKHFNLIEDKPFDFCWVTDFPLFEYDEGEKRFYALHHPFTNPKADDLEKFMSGDTEALKSVRADAYDLVINGYEAGGGSIRIHDPAVQSRMFDCLGISKEDAQEKFGYFLKALAYGTPPHGGIALGVDRIAMVLAGTDGIRDVMAFPKTQKATCLMSSSPSEVANSQLEELHVRVQPPTS